MGNTLPPARRGRRSPRRRRGSAVAPTAGFVGRQDQLAILGGRFSEAARGRPQVVYLEGVMWGAADPQIAELRAFGEERQCININLSQLRRMDFSCGTAFANLVNELAAGGKMVRLIRPDSSSGRSSAARQAKPSSYGGLNGAR